MKQNRSFLLRTKRPLAPNPMKAARLASLAAMLLVWPALTSLQAQPAALLANYTFDNGAIDITGTSQPMQLDNAPVTNSSLFLNGKYGWGSSQGFRAIAPITGFRYDSFTIAFDCAPADFLCVSGGDCHKNLMTGGASYRWFSLREEGGKLEVTLNNGQQRYVIPNSVLVPNRWQSILCSVNVASRKIITFINHVRVMDIDLPIGFRFDVVGSPAESSDKVLTLANYSNGETFSGYIDNLKVWNRALSASEIDGMNDNPALSIQKAVIVSWPNYPDGYVLQCSTNVAGPYEPYTGSIFTEASQFKAALPLSSPQKFFRLFKP